MHQKLLVLSKEVMMCPHVLCTHAWAVSSPKNRDVEKTLTRPVVAL